MKKEDKEKEAYHLWWEYLRRSEDYKEFCEWWEKKRQDKDIITPDKFKKSPSGSAPKEASNYLRFRNIHKWAFEDYWEDRKARIAEYRTKNPNPKPTGITLFSNSLDMHMNFAINSFKRRNNREPTVAEFKEAFLKEEIPSIIADTMLLQVYVARQTTKELIAEFKKLVREKKKEPRVKQSAMMSYRHRQPFPNYLRLDELKRYLTVYDLRKRGLSPKEVIKAHNPKADENHDDVKRAYRADYEKAKKIIKYVEHGIFPGPYDKTSKMRSAKNI